MRKIIATLVIVFALVNTSFAKGHEHKHKSEIQEFEYTLSPKAEAVNVPIDVKVKIIFGEEIDKRTLKHSRILLKYLNKHKKNGHHKH